MDIWAAHKDGYYAVIPTNLTLRHDGRAVMGAGLAKQALRRFPDLDLAYAEQVESGSPCWADHYRRLVLVPTKHNWRNPARLDLVRLCVAYMDGLLVTASDIRLAIPRLGCGLGGLDWAVVRPMIEALPADRILILD